MARHHTREVKAQAVARVLAGESRQMVARDIGVGGSTVKRWVAAANRAETTKERCLADDAAAIAERIQEYQAQVREKLLQRIAARIPKTDNLRDLAIAYGIVTDKALLAAGKPTSIHQEGFTLSDYANEEELVAVAEELRRRRLESPA